MTLPFVGKQLLEIVTAGMYDDPRMAYREYVQNAADSIDVAREKGLLRRAEGTISVELLGKTRSVIIRDDGAGVSPPSIEGCLTGLGYSSKQGPTLRGFRGVGRLGGLAYCASLTFETRASARQRVAVVRWDGDGLRSLTETDGQPQPLADAMRKLVTVAFRRANRDDPPHFFRVHLQGVRKFHADDLMNVASVRSYLSQVAPVPYDPSCFSHAGRVEEHFRGLAGYRTYKVLVNGQQVLRPYSDVIQLSASRSDSIRDVRLFEFLDAQGEPLGLGWHAETDFAAALPAGNGMRGIRVRQGNIQIGDERVLEDTFTERRFTVWQVGEIQIVERKLTPNARRDGFEQSAHYEKFLEQAHVLGRYLSALCRKASKKRSQKQRMERVLAGIEGMLSARVFIDKEHRQEVAQTIERRLEELDEVAGTQGIGKVWSRQRKRLASRLATLKASTLDLESLLDGRSLRQMSRKALLKRLCRSLLHHHDDPASAESLIQKVLEPFYRTRSGSGKKKRK